MSKGFTPSPEKRTVQNRLSLPQIRDLWRDVGSVPLQILCLPGRRCSFLKDLLQKGFTSAGKVTCIERDPTEALLIRGQLADIGDGKGPVAVDIIEEDALAYLTAEDDRAVTARFQVVDLDLYGRLEDEHAGLLESVRAAINVQHRADVRDWLLLLTVEAASARQGKTLEKLRQTVSTLEDAYGAIVSVAMGPRLPVDAGAPQLMQRYSALAAACVVAAAVGRYDVALRGAPRFYRGMDEYGNPSQRALMAAIAFRLKISILTGSKPLAFRRRLQ